MSCALMLFICVVFFDRSRLLLAARCSMLLLYKSSRVHRVAYMHRDFRNEPQINTPHNDTISSTHTQTRARARTHLKYAIVAALFVLRNWRAKLNYAFDKVSSEKICTKFDYFLGTNDGGDNDDDDDESSERSLCTVCGAVMWYWRSLCAMRIRLLICNVTFDIMFSSSRLLVLILVAQWRNIHRCRHCRHRMLWTIEP